MSNLQIVETKILDGLRKRRTEVPALIRVSGSVGNVFWPKFKARFIKVWTERPPPLGKASLAIFMANTLDKEDFAAMKALESLTGEEGANQWLSDVLLRSGEYIVLGDEIAAKV